MTPTGTAGRSRAKSVRIDEVCRRSPIVWQSVGVTQPENESLNLPLVWPHTTAPAPAINQVLLQIQPDADGGPGEIVAQLGYVIPPVMSADEVKQFADEQRGIEVNLVARVMMSKRQAQAMGQQLLDSVAQWDNLERQNRGGSDGD